MSVKAFLDTNLFIYMQSASDTPKKELSYKVLEGFDCVVSVQVLNEFSHVAYKKLNMKTNQIQQIIYAIGNTCSVAVLTLNPLKRPYCSRNGMVLAIMIH